MAAEPSPTTPIVRARGYEHTGVFARDTEELARWYRETFGGTELSRSKTTPPIVFLHFGAGAAIELVPVPEDADPDDTRGDANDHVHLCLTVSEIGDAIERLRSRGVPIERERFAAYDGSHVAFVRDPEGNLVQLVERAAGSEIHAGVYGAR